MKTKRAVNWMAPKAVGVVVMTLGLAIWPGKHPAHALQSTTPALTGSVTSDAEGSMEGVLVNARREGASFTVTVVSDASGEYSFPRDRLEPGEYTIGVRAVGYVLRPSTRVVQVMGSGPAMLDLRLEVAEPLEKALQLSSAEWLASYPLPVETTFNALKDCTRCHHQSKVAMSQFNEEELLHVLQRMSYYWIGSTPVAYQIPERILPDLGREGGAMVRPPISLEEMQAEAVASINLSQGAWQYPLKTFPRPSGDDTRVIYTTYDLARVSARPHDVRMGLDGWVYYDDFNDHVIGKVNPQTGEAIEYRFEDPAQRFPDLDEGGPLQNWGNRVLKRDREGKFYLTPPGVRPGAGYVVRFDPELEVFEFFSNGGSFSAPESMHVDGYMWINGGGQGLRQVRIHDRPPACLSSPQCDGEWTQEPAIEAEGNLAAYDMYVDSQNNAYGASRGSTQFWRVDAKTREVTYYPIPESPRGDPGLGGGSRRGMFDGQDRLWFGGFDGDVIGMLDPSLPPDRAITLFPTPLPWFQPYMAQNDDSGYTWAGSISADHVARMNEETGEWNLYLLPSTANIRQIHVQPDEGGGLSSLWVGLNHQGKMVHIEPLDR